MKKIGMIIRLSNMKRKCSFLYVIAGLPAARTCSLGLPRISRMMRFRVEREMTQISPSEKNTYFLSILCDFTRFA